MNISAIKPGEHLPHEINVIIEIPAFSDPIKFEVDKISSALWVDRFMATSMRYPCNYGFIPHTLAEDGDPVDVLVITPFPLAAGCVISCRPIGMLRMEDESGMDTKILALPKKKLTAIYDHVENIDDLPAITIRQITHFFEHYKDLEPGKWVKVSGWDNAVAAHTEIMAGITRHQ